MTEYFYHVTDANVRIKITKKSITWEQNVIVDFDSLINGTEKRTWKYYMRHSLPVNNVETLRMLYNLSDDAVAKLITAEKEK